MLGRLEALLPFGRYRVEGDSMTPALRDGERVFVSRASYWFRAPREGDIVVLRDPREPSRVLVKRVAGREGDGWVVLGDNPAASTDSRHFGPVGREQIIGKVWFGY